MRFKNNRYINSQPQAIELSGDSFDSIRKLSLQIYNDSEITSLVNDLTIDPASYLKSSAAEQFCRKHYKHNLTGGCRQPTVLHNNKRHSQAEQKFIFDKDAIDFIDTQMSGPCTQYPGK